MITLFKDINHSVGFNKDIAWDKLISYHDVRDEKDGHLYTAAIYEGETPRRLNENVTGMAAIVIDFDNEFVESAPTTPEDLDKLKDYEYYYHSTHSNYVEKHGEVAPRWRLIVPFSRIVTPEEWPVVWQGFYDWFDRDKNIDVSCKSMSRAYYCPSSPRDLKDKKFSGKNQGHKIDPDFLASKRKVERARSLPSQPIINHGTDDVQDALFTIDPDCDYQTWMTMGMALKDGLGDKGFQLWDDWSKRGSKYPKGGEQNTLKKWKSFNSEGITINTMYAEAIGAGWIKVYPEDDTDVVIFEGGNLRPIQKEETVPDDSLNAPNLVGEIAAWITRSAFRPQPALSLAAAVAAVGCVMGHRYRTETDLRSNMLTLGIGPSGCGKDHPRKCVDALFNAAGLESLIGGNDVTSGTALVQSLQRANGRRLFQMDEIGRTFGNLTGKKATSFQSEILTNIMQLFSYANGIYKGKEFVNHADQPRADIVEPCLCIHGSTVPSRFYAAMSSSEAADGFLSRWLVFETTVRTPRENTSSSLNVPIELVNKLKKIQSDISDTGGNLEGGPTPKTKEVPFTAQAKELFSEYGKFCDDQGDAEYESGSGLDPLWTRAREHAYKLSLVAHDIERGEIDANVAKWAIELVTFMVQKNISFLKDRVSDNETEDESKRVLRLIKSKRGWIGQREITRRTQWLKGQRRNEILNGLVEGGLVKVKEGHESGRPKKEFAAV